MNQACSAQTQKLCLLKRYIKKKMVASSSIVTFITLTGHYTSEVHGRGSFKETNTHKDHLFLLAATLWEVRSLALTGPGITTQSKLSSKAALLCSYKTVSRASLLVVVTYLGSTGT